MAEAPSSFVPARVREFPYRTYEAAISTGSPARAIGTSEPKRALVEIPRQETHRRVIRRLRCAPQTCANANGLTELRSTADKARSVSMLRRVSGSNSARIRPLQPSILISRSRIDMYRSNARSSRR